MIGKSKDGDGCSGRHEDNGVPWSSSRKKAKLPRVPKRGPGVAELEKILREEQSSQECDLHAPLPPMNSAGAPQNLCASSSLTKCITSVANLDNFSLCSPPVELLYDNGCRSSGFGHCFNGNGSDGGSTTEKRLLPTRWSSEKPNNYGFLPVSDTSIEFLRQFPGESRHANPPKLITNEKHCNHPPFIINPVRDNPVSLYQITPSAGLNSHVEPPSNQRSYENSSSSCSVQEKIAGARRAWSCFTQEDMTSYQQKLLSFSNQTNRLGQSSSCSVHYLDTSKTIPRMSTAEYKEHGNFLTLGSPTIPSVSTRSLTQEDSGVHAFPLFCAQKNVVESGMSPGSREASDKSHFYSFLQLEEPMELEDNNETSSGIGGDFIDLSLRL